MIHNHDLVSTLYGVDPQILGRLDPPLLCQKKQKLIRNLVNHQITIVVDINGVSNPYTWPYTWTSRGYNPTRNWFLAHLVGHVHI